jgi:hypothetical protein
VQVEVHRVRLGEVVDIAAHERITRSRSRQQTYIALNLNKSSQRNGRMVVMFAPHANL